MKTTTTQQLPALAALICLLFSTSALADCEAVKGRVVSSIVTVYSDGTPCPSPLGLCTEGRFSGDLAGDFRFFASTLTPFAALDPTSPVDTAATTGVIDLDSRKLCKGRLVFADTSAFSLSEDGFVAALDTIVGAEGACATASGRIRISGVFQGGCVDCKYAGDVCGIDDDDDSSDDD